jgi:hypothetical protein
MTFTVKIESHGVVRYVTCDTADTAAWLVYTLNRLPDVRAELIP